MTSRVPPITNENLPPELASDFDIIMKSNGYIPFSYKVLAHRPNILKALMDLSKAVIRDDGTVDRGFRFLIAYISSRTRGCQYCQAHNVKSADRWGISADQLNNVWEYETSEFFTPAERAALSFAQASATVPNYADDAIFKALKAHWSDEQIVEITAVVSLFGWMNCFNDVLHVDLDDETIEWCEDFGLAEKTGWDPVDHI
jgi:uncharacterized peroxidase-related enzyme